MRYLDTLYAVYYDVMESQTLFNRVAVRSGGHPAVRELFCSLRDTDLGFLGLVEREIASVECKGQPASILLPDQD